MSSLALRLERLEKASTGAGRVIVVKIWRHYPDSEIDAFLKTQGIVQTKSDTLVCLLNFVEDSDGEIVPNTKPPEVVNITPRRGRH